ncbi:calcium-activated BK potassium channel alpha subunit-domain-containing protein [Sporodiniella umbellata]|nr:calcium-activated BK potassium channel alpha subunit-domain-containing protein [Sporodiniella umbellata]
MQFYFFCLLRFLLLLFPSLYTICSIMTLLQREADSLTDIESGHNYGSITPSPTNSIVHRKRHRMQQRQSRPSLLPNYFSSRVSNDERQSPEFILSALDPTAREVMDSKNNRNFFRRQSDINLSTVRSNYRQQRKKMRDYGKRKSLKEKIKHFLLYNIYLKKLKHILFDKRTIVLFVHLDMLVDLFFCLTYFVEIKQTSSITIEPSWIYTSRSYRLWIACLAFTYWDLCSFIIRFLMTRHPTSVIFSFRFLIELITTAPFIISNFIPKGQFLYVPYFVRSWVLLLRIKSVMKIKINLQISDKASDPLNTKLIHLVSTLVVLLYNGTCAFQFTEATFGKKEYTILDSLYVVMVTLSTVGYGDITPDNQYSRIIMILLIVIALAVLPGLISDVSDTIQKRKEGQGHVSKDAAPFILIVGSLKYDQVVEILDGFLNKENTQFQLNVVFLDNNRPTEQLKLMERNSIWGHRIQFLQGSVLDEKTLLRVKARYSAAIFTLSDQNAPNPSKEDERNTVRLWSLYCHTASHDVPIYTYNLSPSTAIYQKVAKEIICVREFKHYLLAMNCRCRGASTLLTNLLHQRQPLNDYDEGWQAQFDDGSCNEIYTAPTPFCIQKVAFGQASLYLFEEAQVILFAIKTFMQSKGDYEILLNPSNSYIIKDTDECVFIAENPRNVRELENLPRLTKVYSMDPDYQKGTDPFEFGLKQTAVVGVKIGDAIKTNKPYKVAKLSSKRHAILTGSRALIKRIGNRPPSQISTNEENDTSLPLCYLLESPATLEEATITTAQDMHGHILVCLHREMINMFKFIYNLRSPSIKHDGIQEIVLLCPTKPSKKMFELINSFPKVYFLEGNCRQPEDLLNAGAKTAKQVVVMSEKECLDQYERNSDSPAVMTSHILDLLLEERPKEAYTIVNLGNIV